MNPPDWVSVLDGILDPLIRCFSGESARRISELRTDPAVQAQINALAERANEGLLSEAEQADYEALIDAADFIAILRLKAQRYLAANGG